MSITTGTLQTPQPLASQNYPFMDSASMTSRSGRFIPPTVFIDARIYQTNGTQSHFISKIVASPGFISITIENPASVTGVVEITDFLEQSFSILDANGFDIGVLLLDPYLLQAVVPINTTQEFDATSLPFIATAIIPQPWDGLVGVMDSEDNYISGDIWFIGEDGVVLEVDGNTVVVNIVGDPLYVRKLCLAEGASDIFATRRPLKALRVLGLPDSSFNMDPDDFGNVQIVLDRSNENIVRIQPGNSSLVFSVISGNV